MFGSVLCWCLFLIYLVFKNKCYDCYFVCNLRVVFNMVELVVFCCLKFYKGVNGFFYFLLIVGIICFLMFLNGFCVLVVFEIDFVKKNCFV